MIRRLRRSPLFPVNVWPPFVDAVTLVLGAFVLLMIVALLAQRGLVNRLRSSEEDLRRLRADKERVERRLRALAPAGVLDVDEGKVILQGELLFDSGSADLRPAGKTVMMQIAGGLGALLAAEPGQMVLVGGHTDDRGLSGNGKFASNWDLSTARAVAVARLLLAAGVPADRVLAAGFGEHHPRVANSDDSARRQNRRIEVLLVPIHAVSSR